MENSTGCVYLENGIDFELDKICDCCISHNDGRGLPILVEDYHGEMIDWNALFDVKEKRIALQKEKTIYECEGCYRLTPYQFKNERKISNFHFSHCRVCNSKCIYCSDEYSCGNLNYNTYPVIKDLIEKGYYKAGGEATLQGGEPTLMQNFEELVDLFIEHGTAVRVHTSAIKYSEKVAKALSLNKGTVVISLDSATRETYKKIKQVDAFGAVVESIRKYVEAHADNVIIKYILIPGVNDNLKEIDAFFALMKKLGVKNVALDIEVQYARKYENNEVSPHLHLLNDYFEMMTKKLGIELLTYSFLLYVQRNRKIKKSQFMVNKLLFNGVLKFYNEKEKNLTYKR